MGSRGEGATAKGNTTRVRDGDNAYLNISYQADKFSKRLCPISG